MQRRRVVAVTNARFGDLDDAVGDRAADSERTFVIDLERDEIALVDTDQRGVGLERILQLVLIVDLDQYVEAEFGCERVQISQGAVNRARRRSAARSRHP